MFEQFFGFSSTPFSKSIPSKDMFSSSSSFAQLQNRFNYIKSYRGIMTLTGDDGVGKTSAVRFFLNSLPSQSFLSVYIPISTLSPVDFLRNLNSSLSAQRFFFKSDLFSSIQSQILDWTTNKNIIPVIVLDEAHFLKDQNIRELQIISNFKLDTFDPAIFILVGQNSLLDKLSKPSLNSFYQRISLKYSLEPLSKDETISYILHQFKLCNFHEQLLTNPAFDSVFKLSGGRIRIIGSLVTKSLILAFFEKRRTITEDDIINSSHEVL